MRIVLNADASARDTSDYSNMSCYEELGQVFDKFPTYHTKILL